MFGRKLRGTLIVTASFLVIVALTSVYLLSNPVPSTNFYRDRDGAFLADIRSSANIIQLPLVRLDSSSISASLWVWRAGQWQEERNHLKKLRWNRDAGYRAIIKVPDEKWKIEMRSAPRRNVKLGALNFSLPYRTNLIFSLEFPSRTELENVTPHLTPTSH